MKPRPSSKHKLSKPKPSLLQSQTLRMQSKLQELKKHLKDKKSTQNSNNLLKSKEMSGTGSRFTKEIKEFIGEGRKKEDELTRFYKELKMEVYAGSLKEIGICGMKELRELTEGQIEKLPIPPGYRIKIKKAILKGGEKKEERKEDQSEDIEEIILKREKTKEDQKISQKMRLEQLNLFIPLEDTNRVKEPQEVVFREEGEKHVVEKEYLKQYFQVQQKSQQRIPKSCIKPKSTNTQAKMKSKLIKKVRWDSSVQDYSADTQHKTYPKQSFVQHTSTEVGDELIKNVEVDQNSEEKVEKEKRSKVIYCWECLKRTTDPTLFNEKEFCSTECRSKYTEFAMTRCTQCGEDKPKVDCRQGICLSCLSGDLDLQVIQPPLPLPLSSLPSPQYYSEDQIDLSF